MSQIYGGQRMQTALRQEGWIANHKKLKRLMRELDLNVRGRRCYVATTDSHHDQPIFPNPGRTRGSVASPATSTGMPAADSGSFRCPSFLQFSTFVTSQMKLREHAAPSTLACGCFQ